MATHKGCYSPAMQDQEVSEKEGISKMIAMHQSMNHPKNARHNQCLRKQTVIAKEKPKSKEQPHASTKYPPNP